MDELSFTEENTGSAGRHPDVVSAFLFIFWLSCCCCFLLQRKNIFLFVGCVVVFFQEDLFFTCVVYSIFHSNLWLEMCQKSLRRFDYIKLEASHLKNNSRLNMCTWCFAPFTSKLLIYLFPNILLIFPFETGDVLTFVLSPGFWKEFQTVMLSCNEKKERKLKPWKRGCFHYHSKESINKA